MAHQICQAFQEPVPVPGQLNRRQRSSYSRVGGSSVSVASTNVAAGRVVLENISTIVSGIGGKSFLSQRWNWMIAGDDCQ